MNVLRFEDDLFGKDSYCKAAEGLISIYLHLHDNPDDLKSKSTEVDYSKMSPAEKKKAKAIARKEKKAAEKVGAESANKKVSNGKVSVDDDPDGATFLQCDHLIEAKKYAVTLIKNAPNRFSTWVWQYEVAVRRDKYLMALQVSAYRESDAIFVVSFRIRNFVFI